MRAFAAAAVLSTVLATDVGAHPLAPALLEIRERDGGSADVTWKAPAFGAPGSRLRPLLPSSCARTSAPRTLAPADDLAAPIVWTIDCPGGLAGTEIGIAGLTAAESQVLLRVASADGAIVQRVLSSRRPSFTVPAQPAAVDVVRDYVALGVEHIATGADHLLFVFGLILLIPTWRALTLAISGFTLGHSATLSAAVLGYAPLSSAIAEVCIALSVFGLAVEVARRERVGAAPPLGTAAEPRPEGAEDGSRRPPLAVARGSAGVFASSRRATPSSAVNSPWLLAAGFGLIHGLGFAGALREVGLPAEEVALALLAFNGGIEIGQLGFVFLVLAAVFALRLLPLRLPPWAAHAPAYAMGSLAAFWSIERIAALLT